MELNILNTFFVNKLYISLVSVFMFLICISCGSQKKITTAENSIKGSPKIIFLNYSIEETLNGKRTIQFINMKIVNGKLKDNPSESIENGAEGDLIFSELNSKSKTVNQILIKNPLIKKIEFIDDSKNFKTKIIKSDKIQFSIRLKLKSDTKYITISNFAENEPLIKTQIN